MEVFKSGYSIKSDFYLEKALEWRRDIFEGDFLLNFEKVVIVVKDYF